jgi:serine/threonine-protein kinase RsbW
VRDPGRFEEFTIRSDPRRIREARRWLAGLVAGVGWSGEDCHDLAVALSEACSNAHRYAYAGRTDGRIDLRVALHGDRVELSVRDYGKGFDPKAYREPDLSRPREGGYGIHLMRGLTDRVEHRRQDVGTLVLMTKSKRGMGRQREQDPERSEDQEVNRVG